MNGNRYAMGTLLLLIGLGLLYLALTPKGQAIWRVLRAGVGGTAAAPPNASDPKGGGGGFSGGGGSGGGGGGFSAGAYVPSATNTEKVWS